MAYTLLLLYPVPYPSIPCTPRPGDALGPDAITYLDSIDRLVRRMYTLIEGLLVFARLGREALGTEMVDVAEVLEEVLETLAPELEARGGTVEVVSELPRLETWRLGIQEILANLLGNAIKYIDQAPRVEVGVASADDYGEHAPVPPHATVLYVRDHGIGIDPRHHQSIFRMFQRLHPGGRYGEGSGIGLPVVRKLVERLGGTIWVESAPGTGSTFYFSLVENTNEGKDRR